MQSRAFCRSSPHVYRVVKTVPASTRTMSLFAPRTFGFPVVPSGTYSNPFAISHSHGREVAPLFQMMEDLSRHFDASFFPFANTAARPQAPAPFAPRFDVREVEGAYELRGELPGVDANNLQVEFTDAHTLVIRGRTESETSSGTPPAAVEAQATNAVEASETADTTINAVADDAASIHSNQSYQKATVEDAGEDGVIVERDDAVSTNGQPTPAESVASEQAQPNTVQTTANTAEASSNTITESTTDAAANANAARYWVSERRTGTFQRVFNFPGKIDQEGVSASLKNGVLNVVVPKAVKQAPRRITVQ